MVGSSLINLSSRGNQIYDLDFFYSFIGYDLFSYNTKTGEQRRRQIQESSGIGSCRGSIVY